MTQNTKKEVAEIKPCPFCGARLILKSDHHGEWWGHTEEIGACFLSFIQLIDDDDRHRWNTRAESGVVQRLVEAAWHYVDVRGDDAFEELRALLTELRGEGKGE